MDDNFSKSKFTTSPNVSDSHSGNTLSCTPSSNGAWLVKNSWGTSFGLSGYFWLSYEDSAMLADPAAFYEYDTASNYDHNYQYDGSTNFISEYTGGSSISTPNSFSGVSGGATIANVFTSKQSETLSAVSLYTWDDNLNYTVKIYKGVTGNPTTGTLQSAATTSGTLSYAGYNTIPLASTVSLTQGEKFAVAISLTGSTSTYSVILPVDYTYSSWGVTNSASSGQSYYSKNGTSSWTDVSSKGGNFRIKAFTVERTEPVTGVSVSPTTTDVPLNGTATITATVSPASATNKNVTWSSGNTSIATVDANGVVTGVSTGTTTITATTADGGYTASATVTVKAVAVTGVSLSASSNTVKVGKTVTVTPAFTPSNASNKNVTYTSSSEHATVSASGVVTGVSEGSARITVTTADGSYTAYVDITVTAGSGNYVLLEDDSDLASGDEFVLIGTKSSTNYGAGALNGSYLSAVEGVTIEDDEISELDESIAVFTLGGSNGAWTINSEAGQLYSSAAKNVNYSSNGTGTWSISISSGAATISNSTSTYGDLVFNGNSPRFTTYTSTQISPNIYRLDGGRISVTGVSLDKSSATLTVGGTTQLTETVAPSGATNKNVTWSSSDEAVATVSDSGLVTAVGVGSATITVTTVNGSFTATCAITVNPVRVTGVTLNQSTATLTVGGTVSLTATVAPSNATNKNVTWSSNNTSAATVNSNGVVTAVGVGEATITATTADGSFTASCVVTVNPVAVTSVTLDRSTASLEVGNHIQLTATVNPNNATTKTVTWTSSAEGVATVSNTGYVTAVSVGSATITVASTTDATKNATCVITVKDHVTTVAEVETVITEFKEDFAETREDPTDLTSLRALITAAEEKYDDLDSYDQTSVSNRAYIAAMSEVVDFLETKWYGVVRIHIVSRARTANDEWSICECIADAEKSAAAINNYEALSDEAQDILDETYDITASNGETITVGQSMRMISNSIAAQAAAQDSLQAITNTTFNKKYVLVTAMGVFSVISISAVSLLVIRRKKAN